MNYNSTISYRRKSSKSASTKIFMFIVCTLIIAIGVLKYLKSQEEDISTTDSSEIIQFSAVTPDSITPVVNNPVVKNNQITPVVNPNVVNNPVVKNNQITPVVNPNVVNNPVVKNNQIKPVVNPNVVSNPVVQNNQNPVVSNPFIQNNQNPVVNSNGENSTLKLEALSQDKEIVIKDGDLLWKICNDEYKNGSYCDKVIEYNKHQYNNIINPKQLKKNSVIYLPPVSYFKTESKKTTITQVSIKNNTKNNTHVSLNNKPQSKKANDKIYEIQNGDTFSSISRKEYKTCKYAKAILDYNNSVYHLNLNEKKLQIKTKIYLPSKGYFADNDTIHIVKANETLGTISQKHYKTSKYATLLQKYNHIKDISKLQINQEILIPSLSALEKMETGKLTNREAKRKSNSDKIDLEKLSNYQLISVKKSMNTWDSLAKCYQISKSKLIECNNGLYKIYPTIIPEASQIKIPIQIAQRKSL